eukprot:3375558-Karenia_brevis.AAC.1
MGNDAADALAVAGAALQQVDHCEIRRAHARASICKDVQLLMVEIASARRAAIATRDATVGGDAEECQSEASQSGDGS